MDRIDPAQLGRWFDAYGARLELYALQWLPSAQAADAVQEVFLRLWQLGQEPADVAAWLFTAARNAAISHVRSAARRRSRELLASQDRPDWFLPDASAAIDAAAAKRMLMDLGAEQRELVILKIWGSLSFRQISEVVARPLTTIRREYVAALDAMRERMDAACPKKME